MMRTGLWPWLIPLLVPVALVAAFWLGDRVVRSLQGQPHEGDDTDRAKARRRGTSGAAFALQQVFDPGVEHVLRAERDAKAEEADPSGGGDDPATAEETVLAELAAALGRATVDPEEVRRVLAAASRDGHDWRALYDEAVGALLADRPYLAPRLPPAARVAPRG